MRLLTRRRNWLVEMEPNDQPFLGRELRVVWGICDLAWRLEVTSVGWLFSHSKAGFIAHQNQFFAASALEVLRGTSHVRG